MHYPLHETEHRQKTHPPSILLPAKPPEPRSSHTAMDGAPVILSYLQHVETHHPSCGRALPSAPFSKNSSKTHVTQPTRSGAPPRTGAPPLPCNVLFRILPQGERIQENIQGRCLLWLKWAEKTCLRRPGDDPLDPILRMPSPFVPQGEDLREGFYEIKQDLFIKLFKSLAPGRAAGGVS